MQELSEERLKKNENELFYYGICSTDIYIDYREIIDKQLKLEMVNMIRICNENNILDESLSEKNLFKKYQEFWVLAEPSLQKFYEEVQEIFAVPHNCVPNTKDILHLLMECNQTSTDTRKLDEEEENFLETYCGERYFTSELEHQLNKVNSICLPLTEKLKREIIRNKRGNKKFENLEKTIQRCCKIGKDFMGNNKELLNNVVAITSQNYNKKLTLEYFNKLKFK